MNHLFSRQHLIQQNGPLPKGQRLRNHHSSESGLTLVESLVAVVMIAVAVSATLPPLFMAAATRVQNRRFEQAMQLAQGEVDRVRTMVEQNNHYTPSSGAAAANIPQAVVGEVNINAVTAPSEPFGDTLSFSAACNDIADPTALSVPVNQLLPIDIDGKADCKPEFYMQTFRIDKEGGLPLSQFQLGVRVYSASIKNNNFENLSVEEASLKMTTGAGFQTTRPLAVLYTQITKADQQETSLCPFYNLPGC